MPSVTEILSGIESLPGLSPALREILPRLGDDRLDGDELARMIARDAVLAERVLRLANASRQGPPPFGSPRLFGSLAEAVATLGCHGLRGLVLSLCLSEAFAGSDQAGVARAQAAAAAAAALAGELARAGQSPPARESPSAGEAPTGCDAVYSAALLHNLGALLLGRFAPRRWRAMAAVPSETPRDRLVMERRVFGFDHCELGASVARQWHFPDGVVRAIWSHQCPREEAADRVTDLVHVAWALSAAGDDGDTPDIDAGAIRRLGLDTAALATARAAMRVAGHAA